MYESQGVSGEPPEVWCSREPVDWKGSKSGDMEIGEWEGMNGVSKWLVVEEKEMRSKLDSLAS